jgi:hypothetical protein
MVAQAIEFYVIPPIAGQQPHVGELYWGNVCGNEGHWLVLTPSCDFVQKNNAENVVLARCVPLIGSSEYKKVQTNELDTGDLKSLMNNRRAKGQPERFHYLPGLPEVLPHLIADFQQLHTVARADLDGLDRIGHLASPYAESMVARFVRFFGRVGVEDPDIPALVSDVLAIIEAAGEPPAE